MIAKLPVTHPSLSYIHPPIPFIHPNFHTKSKLYLYKLVPEPTWCMPKIIIPRMPVSPPHRSSRRGFGVEKQGLLQGQQQDLVPAQDSYMASRAEALQNVETTIAELSNIFQNLAVMVQQQGEVAIRWLIPTANCASKSILIKCEGIWNDIWPRRCNSMMKCWREHPSRSHFLQVLEWSMNWKQGWRDSLMKSKSKIIIQA